MPKASIYSTPVLTGTPGLNTYLVESGADPDRVLAGFSLTNAEKANLKCMEAEILDLLAIILAVRFS